MTEQQLAAKREQLVDDLTNVVAKHLEWLDSADFMSAAQRVTDGYFERPDPDEAFVDAVVAGLRAQLKIAEA